MSSTVEVLRQARELYARAPSHAGVDETPEHGTYCPLYALLYVTREGDQYFPAEMSLRRAMGFGGGIVAWAAENSTETVLAAFDRAIEAEALKVAE